MTWKEMLLTGGWSEKYRGHVRPVWQIVLMIPVMGLYWAASRYVKWADTL